MFSTHAREASIRASARIRNIFSQLNVVVLILAFISLRFYDEIGTHALATVSLVKTWLESCSYPLAHSPMCCCARLSACVAGETRLEKFQTEKLPHDDLLYMNNYRFRDKHNRSNKIRKIGSRNLVLVLKSFCFLDDSFKAFLYNKIWFSQRHAYKSVKDYLRKYACI